MDFDTRMQNLAVIGAAGKMGRGIALLLALETAFRALEAPGAARVLSLVDTDDGRLQDLLRYLRDQARKEGEKRINRLRVLYRDRADLVENGEMVQAFTEEVLLHVRTGRTLALAADAHLIFEAAFEKVEVKAAIYDQLVALCPEDTWFLTNTSSIPLHVLAARPGLGGRLIGFHFYNPPAVQKLLELIVPGGCDPALEAAARELARVLRKQVVPARDIAGFIGNGHFTRDALHGLRTAERLSVQHGFPRAAAMVERVTRDWLLRPMGVFQLVDYVGIDVFALILEVMESHLAEGLHSGLVDRCLALGIRGGQTGGGAPRDGFLHYEQGRPAAILDPATGDYVPMDAAFLGGIDQGLGPRPDSALAWKSLSGDPLRESRISDYFRKLGALDSPGAALAREHLAASREAALGLVERGVAARSEDVNDVLTLGFYHLYGPVNDLLEWERP